MTETIPIELLLRFALPASALLAVGLMASGLVRRRAALAHSALVAAAVAALAAPTIGATIRALPGESVPAPVIEGVKRLRESFAPMNVPPPAPERTGAADVSNPRGAETSGETAAKTNRVAKTSTAKHARSVSMAAERTRPPAPPEKGVSFPWHWLSGVWLALTLAHLWRFGASMRKSRRVVHEAKALNNERLHRELALAKSRIGLRRNVRLALSNEVSAPAIWCWGRKPVLLVPESARAADPVIDWAGLFAHELAHAKRGDHIASALFEFLACLLPWNPLVWMARGRAERLSEMACDDWALAGGSRATDYAEALLAWGRPPRPALKLSAARGTGGIKRRIVRILDEKITIPQSGKGWTIMIHALFVTMALLIGLAQATIGVSADGAVRSMTERKLEGQYGPALAPFETPLKGPSGESILSLGSYRTMAVSPDERFMVVVAQLGAFVWDFEKSAEQPAHWIRVPRGQITAAAIAPDNRLLALGADNGSIMLWDLETGERGQTIEGAGSHPHGSMVFSPDQSHILVWSGSLKLFNLNTGGMVKAYLSHDANRPSYSHIEYVNGGTQILSGGFHGAYVWDAESGEIVHKIIKQTLLGFYAKNDIEIDPPIPGIDYIRAVDGSADGSKVLLGTQAGNVILCELPSMQMTLIGKHTPKGDEDFEVYGDTPTGIDEVALSPDGTRAASGGYAGDVYIWDIPAKRRIALNDAFQYYVNDLMFTHDSSKLYSASHSGPVYLWDANTGELRDTFHGGPTGFGRRIMDASYMPGGDEILVWRDGDTVEIVSAADGSLVRNIEGAFNDVYLLALSNDKTRAVTRPHIRGRMEEVPPEVHVWDLTTGQLSLTLKGHEEIPNNALFSPDDSKILTAGGDRTVKIWDATTGECLQTLYPQTRHFAPLAFTPDGKKVLTGGYGDTYRLWDIASGREVLVMDGNPRDCGIMETVFSPDGSFFLDEGENHIVKLWNVGLENVYKTFQYHSDTIAAVDYSPTHNIIVTAGEDWIVRLWGASGGMVIDTWLCPIDAMSKVEFAPDGRSFLVAAGDGSLRVFPLGEEVLKMHW